MLLLRRGLPSASAKFVRSITTFSGPTPSKNRSLKVLAGATVFAAGTLGVATASGETTQLSTWGWNQFGQLGHGDQANRLLPTVLDFFTSSETPVDVFCGARVTGIVTESGALWTWGSGQDGRLGHGDDSNQESPRQVSGVDNVAAAAFGEAHGLALTKSGEVYAFGKGYGGQLGLGDKKQRSEPVHVEALKGKNIRQVACGGKHSVALGSDGTVYAFGRNHEGQLGIGASKANEVSPVEVSALKGKNVVAISAGGEYSAALTADGLVYTWGSDFNGQLGIGKKALASREPALVTGMRAKKVAEIACGEEHMAVRTVDGSVYTWGYGRDGQLCHGTNSDECLPREVNMKGVRAKQVACGDGHTAIVGADGNLWLCGRGRDGQIGRADHIESVAAYRASPVLVTALQGQKVLKVALGSDHTTCISTTPAK